MTEQPTMTEKTVPTTPTMPAAPAVAPAVPDEQPFDKEAWAAKKKEQRQALYDLVDATIVQASKDFSMMRQYLAVQARFDRYSVNNAMLVAAQCPTATRLGDFEYWRNHGASVVHGAKAIHILEPGTAYNSASGNVGHNFNIKSVFDVSQTTADPRRAPQTPDYRRFLQGLISASPVKVQALDEMPDARETVYDVRNGIILAHKGLTPEKLCLNLTYTIALARLAHQKEHPVNINFSAKAVSFMIYQRYGIPNTGLHYNSQPKEFENMNTKDVRAQLDTIRQVAHEMTIQISRAMKPVQKEAPKEEAR